MLGHSVGGASAIVAASRDPRIVARCPSQCFSSAIKSLQIPLGWQWPQLKGAKLVVHIANTLHQSFTDVATLLQAARQSTVPYKDLLGTIAPAKMVRILAAYTTAWMNAFKGKEGGALLQGQEPGKFPEVSIMIKGNF